MISLALPAIAIASALSYFQSGIDYWGENKVPPFATEVEKSNAAQEGKFPWKTYLDPKNKEFFKEGDYTPPEPFMEVARNPSKENLKNWFELMRRKNELAQRLDQKVNEFLIEGRGTTKPQAEPSMHSAEKIDPSRFKIRMYFESTCPHCKRMFGVLKQLREKGIEVSALQIDQGPVPEEAKTFPIGPATKEEIGRIKAVPYLLVADKKRKALLPPIQGYHDIQAILGVLSASK